MSSQTKHCRGHQRPKRFKRCGDPHHHSHLHFHHILYNILRIVDRFTTDLFLDVVLSCCSLRCYIMYPPLIRGTTPSAPRLLIQQLSVLRTDSVTRWELENAAKQYRYFVIVRSSSSYHTRIHSAPSAYYKYRS